MSFPVYTDTRFNVFKASKISKVNTTWFFALQFQAP